MRRIYINAGPYGMFLFRYILIEFQKAEREQPGIYIDRNNQNQDEYVIYEDMQNENIDILSNILVQYIFSIYEPEIIGGLIGNLSDFYDYSERYDIFNKTKNKISDYDKQIEDSKKSAYVKILDLLRTQNIFNIEGFIVFRLKEYIFFLRKIVEEALDDFLSEKEHKEFMRMLAYFVDMQESRTDTTHIITSPDSGYMLYDELGNRYFLHENTAITEHITLRKEAEDILIGMLMSLLPKKIIIHDKDNLMTVQTVGILKEIFSEKIEMCHDCPNCHIYDVTGLLLTPQPN